MEYSRLHKPLLLCVISFFSFIIDSKGQAKDGEATVTLGETTTIYISSAYQTTLRRASSVNYYWTAASSDVSVVSSSSTFCTIRGNQVTNYGRVDYHCSYIIDGYFRTMDFYYEITVKSNIVYVSMIGLNTYSLKLDEDDSYQLSAEVYPSNATNKNISWSSNNSSVASVTSYGLVTANSGGSAVITCRATDGSGTSETCNVTVSPRTIYVTGLSLNTTSSTLSIGETIQLSASITPSNATNKSVSWTSSNTNVATVSNSGFVTAQGTGNTVITCQANDGSGKKATCSVTVQQSIIKVSSVTLNQTSASIFVEGPDLQLTATILPNNASDKSVTWSSSNTDVATVDNSGLVTAISAGTAKITCKANDGSDKYATCEVTVNWTNADIRIISVSCDNSNLNQLTQNDKLKFHAIFENVGETDYIYSAIMILDETQSQIIANGDYDIREYPTGEQISIDYEYSLDTIPDGHYYASVMFYDWNYDYWSMDDSFIWEISISQSGTPKGDVNGDGQVNGTDLVALTNIILGKSTNKTNADVNGDGNVNGTDYVALVNLILKRNKVPRKTITSKKGNMKNLNRVLLK